LLHFRAAAAAAAVAVAVAAAAAAARALLVVVKKEAKGRSDLFFDKNATAPLGKARSLLQLQRKGDTPGAPSLLSMEFNSTNHE